MSFFGKHAGKIVLGVVGVAAGVATGGVGFALLGTAFGTSTAGTAVIAGTAGALVGNAVDDVKNKVTVHG